MLELIKGSFTELFDNYITRLDQHKEWPMHVCGSIGYHFHHILSIMAEERGITFGQVIQKPIAALTLYHLES